MAHVNGDSKALSNPCYLKKHGLRLVELGYSIHPVRFMQKGIFEDGWQSVRATAQTVKAWAANGHGTSGVSILTYKTPVIDIDCTNADMVHAAARIVEDVLGVAFEDLVVRQGAAPKLAIVCRTEQPFTKFTSSWFGDAMGDKHRVEILGDGQQLVAYNVHPDTKLPYTYLTQNELINTPVDQLPLLTAEKAAEIIRRIEAEFVQMGYDILVKGNAGRVDDFGDDDDARFLANYTAADTTVSEQRITEALEILAKHEYFESYEKWVTVGMALYHQYEGDDQGFELWDQWSMQASNYGGTAKKWDSFEADLRRKPVTIGTILHWAKELKTSDSKQWLENLSERINTASSADELRGPITDEIKQSYAEISPIDRDVLTNKLQARLKEFDVSVAKSIVAASIKPSKVSGCRLSHEELLRRHPWIKGWYWLVGSDDFYNQSVGSHSERSFRRKYKHKLAEELTKYPHIDYGPEEWTKTPGFRDPVSFVDHYGLIPLVNDAVYAPGHPEVIKDPRSERLNINTFTHWVMPDDPEGKRVPDEVYEWDWDDEQRAAVDRFIYLFHINAGGDGHERERDVLLSFFAHRYQNPSVKNRWAPFLVGPKGCGKSTLKDYFVALMGISHVTEVSPDELESAFSAWAGRAMLAFVDEIHTEGRAARDHVATRIRTHITSDLVTRIPKGRDGILVPNFQDYVFISNDLGGLPIDEGERRFLVLESAFKTREEAKAAVVDSGYREQLGYDMQSAKCLAAVRGFLAMYQLHPEFTPYYPIETAAKSRASENNLSSLAEVILDAIEDDRYWWATEEWVSVTHLLRHVSQLIKSGILLGVDKVPSAMYFAKILANAPFDMRDSSRVEFNREKYRLRVRRLPETEEGQAAFVAGFKQLLETQTDPDDDWG